MIYFGIPLRSKETANNWDKVNFLIEHYGLYIIRQTLILELSLPAMIYLN